MRIVLITYFIVLLGIGSMAQTAINEDGSAADPTARVDIKSTTKGVLFPSLTTVQRDAIPSPTQGLIIYNSTTGYFNYYSGSKWCEIDRTESINPAINPAGAENDNGMGVGIDDPDNSAILHLSATDKGLLLPRLTSDVSGAPEGMIYYRDNNFIRYYDGTSWVNMLGSIQSDAAGGTGTENGIAFGKSSVDLSAIMEVYATDKGLLIPRMTTAQRDAINSPAEGLLIYNNEDNIFQYYSAMVWYNWSSNATSYGDTEDFPGQSCLDILTVDPTAGDGNYWIDPDGSGGVAAFECQCDMTTDGGGWITMELNQTNQIYIHSYSSTNDVFKAGDDGFGLEIDNYTHLTSNPAHTLSYGGDHTVVLSYINPATAGNFTAAQLTAIRGIIDRLSTTTRMIALTSDDDNLTPGHVVGIYDADDNFLELTPGYSGNENWGAWKWNTTAGGGTSVLGATGSPAPGDLPAEYIIPKSVFLDENTGGGMMWGYEDAQFLVK